MEYLRQLLDGMTTQPFKNLLHLLVGPAWLVERAFDRP